MLAYRPRTTKKRLTRLLELLHTSGNGATWTEMKNALSDRPINDYTLKQLVDKLVNEKFVKKQMLGVRKARYYITTGGRIQLPKFRKSLEAAKAVVAKEQKQNSRLLAKIKTSRTLTDDDILQWLRQQSPEEYKNRRSISFAELLAFLPELQAMLAEDAYDRNENSTAVAKRIQARVKIHFDFS